MTDAPEHGTRQRYQRKCRCGECTHANTLYQRDYRASWQIVHHPAGPVRFRQPQLPHF
jgi:transposase